MLMMLLMMMMIIISIILNRNTQLPFEPEATTCAQHERYDADAPHMILALCPPTKTSSPTKKSESHHTWPQTANSTSAVIITAGCAPPVQHKYYRCTLTVSKYELASFESGATQLRQPQTFWNKLKIAHRHSLVCWSCCTFYISRCTWAFSNCPLSIGDALLQLYNAIFLSMLRIYKTVSKQWANTDDITILSGQSPASKSACHTETFLHESLQARSTHDVLRTKQHSSIPLQHDPFSVLQTLLSQNHLHTWKFQLHMIPPQTVENTMCIENQPLGYLNPDGA